MPQIATTEDKKPTDRLVSTGPRVAEIAHETAEAKRATQAPQRTAWATEPTRSRATAADRFGIVAPDSLFQMFNVGGNIAAMWFNLAQAQFAANVETLSRLAANRDWRDQLEIRSSFVCDNLARMSEGLARSAELSVDLASSYAAMARECDVQKTA